MNKIFKYKLTGSVTIIEMPQEATILTAQYQFGELCLWAIVNTASPVENKCFEIFGTGEPLDLPAEAPYIGTVQRDGLVWHVFEKY